MMIKRGVIGGLFIGIGGAIYLTLFKEQPILAAVLFSIALNSIVLTGAKLFTGSIGFVEHQQDWEDVVWILLGNCCDAVVCAILVSATNEDMTCVALPLVQAKLTKSWAVVFLQAYCCGVLMYTAVRASMSATDTAGKILIITFCVTTFILSGFEHSIADFFYYMLCIPVADITWWRAPLFFFAALLGNTLGARTVHRYLI